jgi:hypothetical protein
VNRAAFRRGVAMIFAVNVAAIALRAYAEGAFLASYGAGWIPVLLVSQAVAFALGTLVYDAATGRAPSATVDVAVGLGLTVAAAIAPPLVARGGPWPFAITLLTTTLGSVANVALWNTVAASVAGRDARRMLPRAGAAITAGGAVAGFAAAAVTSRLGAAAVPRLAAVVALLAVAAAIAAQRALARDGAPGMAAPPGASPGLARDHRSLLAWLALAAIAEAAIATALEFRFGAALKAAYAGGALATAVSLFHGGTHAIQLVLQALVIPRLLTSQRLPVTVAIHPALTALGSLALVIAPGFASVAALRTGEKVLRSATARTGQEVSLSALPPAPRARWKVLLRGLFTPIGAAAGALILVGIGTDVLFHPVRFAAVVTATALVLAWSLRRAARAFVAALAAPLGMRAVALGGPAAPGVDLDELRRVVDASGGPSGALAAAALYRTGGAADELAGHLAHDDPAVRRALYELATRRPHAAATAELIAAVAIEDDPTARVAGLAALAAHRAKDALAAQDAGRAADADVARAIRAARAEVGLATPAERAAIVLELVGRDGAWAARIARGDPPPGYDAAIASALAGPARGHALTAASAGGPAALAELIAALVAGDRDAAAVVADLDERQAAAVLERIGAIDRDGRAALARARAAAVAPGPLVWRLAADPDADVRAAALRSLAGHARAGRAPTVALADACLERERAALAALVAARAVGRSPLHHGELTRAIVRATRRVVSAAALTTAAAGRDPLPLLAAGRRMLDAPEPLRRRALDLFQEVATAPLPVLDLLEASLRPPTGDGDRAGLAAVDPWLAALLAGERAAHEPALAALRRCAFFDDLGGEHVEALAIAAPRRHLAAGAPLVEAGAASDAMYVVLTGHLTAAGEPALAFGPGELIGELGVLEQASRSRTVLASEPVEVLTLSTEAFTAALARWPELGGALLRTLAARCAARPSTNIDVISATWTAT